MAFLPSPRDIPVSLTNIQEDMNRLMERVWHAGLSTGPLDGQEWAPAMDMYEDPEGYRLYFEMPGVNPQSVDVSYVGQTLTVRGTKPAPTEEGEHCRSMRTERRYGSFCRAVDLPDDVDAEQLSAKCQGGVLTITIPKSDASKPKSIKIDVVEG